MYWRFDPNKFALHMLPPILRRKGIYALLKCLMIGIGAVHKMFVNFREVIMRQLNYNGFTISLERFLNEQFSLEKEIFIKDYAADNVYLHMKDETPEEVYAGYQTEGDMLVLSSTGPDKISGGFTVMIPVGLATEENILIIRKWVDYYRMAGTMYKIETYE